MNVQCQGERRSLVKQSTINLQASAKLGDRFVAAREIATTLRAACQAIDRPEFTQSVSYVERQAGRARFSPSLSFGRHFCPPLPSARPAAVMMLIEPRNGQWVIPLTVRPNHLPDHPGQVCLPGGRVEAGETLIEAAERETCEELGLAAFPGRTLGQLQSIYVYNSDFIMTPCVAVCQTAYDIQPNPDEVAALVYLPVADLLREDRHVMKTHQRGHVSWSALGIDAGDVHVWGATAIVLGELAAVLKG